MIINLKKYKENSYLKGAYAVFKKMFLSLNQPLLLDIFNPSKKKEVYKSYPQYLVDPLSGIDLCTTCEICQSVCPSDSIKIIKSDDGFEGPIAKSPKNFYLNLQTCVKCGYCISDCPENALNGDGQYNFDQMKESRIDIKKTALKEKI